jgi:hypothetical protein
VLRSAPDSIPYFFNSLDDPMTTFPGALIAALAQYFIVALVWLAGAILAVITWQQHPKASRYTLIALAIFFIEFLVSYTSIYVSSTLSDQGWTIGQLQIWYFCQNGFLSLIQAAAWGFIFAAIFGRRDKP